MLYFLLLGSNAGEQLTLLNNAIRLLEEQLGRVQERSRVYETAAWGDTSQPNYYNQVVTVRSQTDPHKALKTIQQIELELGRTRSSSNQNASRTMDIDILLIDDLIINTPELTVPHPRLPVRNFALLPLIELAGDMMHPVLQIELDDVYEQCPDDLEVWLLDDEEEG